MEACKYFCIFFSVYFNYHLKVGFVVDASHFIPMDNIVLMSQAIIIGSNIICLMSSYYNPAHLQIKTVPVAFEELLQMTDPSSKDFLENILFVLYFCCVFLCHLVLLITIINAIIFITTTKRK